MIRTLSATLCVLLLVGCKNKSAEKPTPPEIIFTFDRSQAYTLVPPIPADDQWLTSFKAGHHYDKGWETWVWCKTNINIGDGITVYARDEKEQQFLISGTPGLPEITVNFREQNVGNYWDLGNTHRGSLTPSKNYVVVITNSPRSYLADGMSLKERDKTDAGWDFAFDGNRVSWWKRPNGE